MTPALKKLASLALLMAAGGFAYIHLQGPKGIPALLEKHDAIEKLEEKNRLLRESNDRQRARNLDLQRPEVLELEIRKRVNKLRDNEKDFKLSEEDKSESKPAQ
ncbi:MAG: hypothetical protein JJE04_14735 [Acidobacteriia bacterium]|nr:hypothetical protein [Terriglobia bacterium]